MKTWKFGIIGPGKIANRFADAFQFVPRAKVTAIASRDRSKAETFAKAHQIEKIHDSYEALAKDPEVDIIYVATPHPYHYEHAMLCLKYGKAVLCEKPLAMNLNQVKEMTALAQSKKVFFMEGMWSRFFPVIHKALELIKSGAIGDIQFLNADFGFPAPANPDSRIFNLALGGGAQLDVGVYPMFLALLVLGKPDNIKAISQKTSTGADGSTSAIFHYPSGAVAHIFSSVMTDTPKDAYIFGTKGCLHIHGPWYKSQSMTLRMNNDEKSRFPFPHSGNGFEFQIEEVVRCLDQNLTECPLLPHSMSVLMAETADEILRQGGVKYPGVE
ncbi:MAG TPA: Gfo/Idh/MocA family oxidoreductase [Cyclobacteriaceae bacterium]|nr:Gfo/Idh/MocA family oxidoreductase [Cyclobacteriaceae bacterium]